MGFENVITYIQSGNVVFCSKIEAPTKGKEVTRDEYGLSDNPFDINVYETYLKHLNYDALSGLTVAHVHDWTLGSAMQWPRQNFHVSANFTNKDTRASVLITTRYK